MIIGQFERASDTGRMAYLILCLEEYLTVKMPERDWTPVLEVLWSFTRFESWDDWSAAAADIIPSCFFDAQGPQDFEYLSKEQCDKIAVLYQDIPEAWEELLGAVQHAAPLYANGTRDCREYADEDANLVAQIMQKEGVPLPSEDVASLSPAHPRAEHDKPIDAALLSRVLDYQP